MQITNMDGLLKQLPPALHEGWPWQEETDPDVYKERVHWPKISIVTPCYNQGQYIEETIRSILLQNYPNLEYIIMDGGSTDNTKDVIEKYAPWITYWVSEKDKGQVDAINKGVKRCTGEIFNWINSDDFLLPGSLYTIGNLYTPGATIAGSVINLYEEVYGPTTREYISNTKLEIESFLNFEGSFHQPGIWCSLKEFKEAGMLPTDSTYYFDRIFLNRYFLNNNLIIYTDKALVGFRMHQSSKTATIQHQKHDELINAFKKMLQLPEFSNYHQVIRRCMKEQLLPYNAIAKWELQNKHKSKLGKFFTYLMLPIHNSGLINNRYYYILLKRKIRTGKW